MENTTPFSDALNVAPSEREQTEIDILRESNSKFKLELLELREILEDQINAKQIAQKSSDKFQAEYYSLRSRLNEIKTILKCN